MQPEHPDTILVKNKYYPSGLKEIDIYDYYQKNKEKILSFSDNRYVMFYIFTDINKFIIKRKKEDKFLILNNSTWNELITGRTVSIHLAMKQNENIGIIDIDYHDFKIAKEATLNTYEYVVERMPFVEKTKIFYTGKEGFHIECLFKKKMNIDGIRMLLLKALTNSPLKEKYDVGFRRSKDRPNLDLSPNKINGNYICPYSLSEIGLMAKEIYYNDLLYFEKSKAKI